MQRLTTVLFNELRDQLAPAAYSWRALSLW